MRMLDISNTVLAELENGQSRKHILQHLVTSSPKDVAKIAYCIASTPRSNLRQKYLKHNAILCVLLVLYSVLTVLTAMPIDLSQPTIFLLITTVLPLIFSYFIFRFHGGTYRLIGCWYLLDLLETILLTGVPDGLAALKLMSLFFVITLSFYIARKVFSHLQLIGPKKDTDGNYLLG